MNAVGDVPDRHCIVRRARVEARPHVPGYFSVKSRNRIRTPRKLQAYDGHTELFMVISRILAAQLHQSVMGEPEGITQRSKMLFDQIRVEPVMSRRHRSMRREHDFAGDSRTSLIERDAFLPHAIRNPLQHRESTVSLVEVKNAGS